MSAEFSAETPESASEREPGRAPWQQLVEGVLAKSGKTGLSGPEAEAAITTEVEEGLRIQPLYTAADAAPDPGWPGFAPFTRGDRVQGAAVSGWDVRQRLADPDPGHANAAVLADLENGVTSLWLVLGEGALPVDALPTVLEHVLLDLAPIKTQLTQKPTNTVNK